MSAHVTRPSRVNAVFRGIGEFAVRFRYAVIGFWAVVLCATFILLPSLSSVATGNNSAFLPKSSPVVHAIRLIQSFTNTQDAQSILVVDSPGPLTSGDLAAISRLARRVRHVGAVRGVSEFGTSADGKAVQYYVESTFSSTDNVAIVSAIRHAMAASPLPAGLHAYLTGPFATTADAQSNTDDTLATTQYVSVILIFLLLVLVFRSPITPVIALLPAGFAIGIAGPIIAKASQAGVSVSDIMQVMLSVLLLGAGTDYAVFLIFRVREEVRNGTPPKEAIVNAVERIGESITFSALTVIVALLTLIHASFSLYSGLGPGLAIGVAIMLLLGLTFLPAMLAVAGRWAFWPRRSGTQEGPSRRSLWTRVATPIVSHPVPTLLVGVIVFSLLSIGVSGYTPSGFSATNNSTSSQSARGAAVLADHFPAAEADPTMLIFRLPSSVYEKPETLSALDTAIRKSPLFKNVNGPLDPNGTMLSPSLFHEMALVAGPPGALSTARGRDRAEAAVAELTPAERAALTVLLHGDTPAAALAAYATDASFVSPAGTTVIFDTSLAAGSPDSTAALDAVPSVSRFVSRTAVGVHATAYGVDGVPALDYDIDSVADSDLLHIVPLVLFAILLLLALVLRSLIAPLYLIASVVLSFFAAFGLANIIFVKIGGDAGLNFILPFLMFIFLMALGEDYNILLMTRIREEATRMPLRDAVVTALTAMGGSITSAGLILAGTFAVFGLLGAAEVQQIGLGIAFGILMDTFLVRTVLVPSAVMLVKRWNWWPSKLAARAIRSR